MTPLVPLLALAAVLGARPASAQGDALTSAAKGSHAKFDRKNNGNTGGVQGHAIDLSKLLGPEDRVVPGPSVEDSGPDKYTKMVLTAVDQIVSHKDIIVGEFQKVFNGGIDADAVDEAAKVIRQRISAKQIKVGQGEGLSNGAAAYWQPEPVNGDWMNGTMGLNKSLLDGTAASYRATQGPTGFAFNCGADDVANTILHETTHIFYTYFSKVKGLQSRSETIPERFTYRHHWNGPVQANGTSARCKRLPSEQGIGYTIYLTKSGYPADDGNEASARIVASRLQEETSGDALHAVLGELF